MRMDSQILAKFLTLVLIVSSMSVVRTYDSQPYRRNKVKIKLKNKTKRVNLLFLTDLWLYFKLKMISYR